MSTEKSVHFYSDGLKLAGVLFLPATPGPHAGVVLCHGFTGVKELILPDYARRFVDAGFAALTFDYRGFGESEGPRWRLIPGEQVIDIRNAITFLQCQPEVDAQKIGLWGTSYGGAHVPYVAGIDERVKCAVGQVGFGDGGRLFRRKTSDQEAAMLKAMLEQDRQQRVLTGKSATVDPLQILSDEDSVRFMTAALQVYPQLRCQIPLETTEATLEYKPEEVVHRISPRALLLIAVEHDLPCPKEEYESMYARAGEPKKLVVLPGLRHYDVYAGEGAATTARLALDWFREHLA
ncbi:MAG: alpha/beta hydrolase [Chloroflexi bacterium]|nr:alpha/beta hydrolase [Chloroflexota bacterium]